MRKLIFALLLLVAAPVMVTLNVQPTYASGGGNSTKIPASQVPKPVKKTFHADFPSATQVEWEITPMYYGSPVYTASFKMNGQKWEASFSADGVLLSSGPKA